jgi:DNA-binding CsgD family transcriptional regulator
MWSGSNGKLDIGHVHQLIRLLSEARDIPADGPERGQHLVCGVARIVDAAAVGAVFDTNATPESCGPPSAVILVGWDRAALRAFMSMIRAMIRITPSEPGATVTATWHELVADRGECGAGQVEHYVRPTGLLEPMFSSVRLRARSHVHGLGLYRTRANRPFTEEDRNLVHVFHAECEDLLYASPCDGDDDEPVRARLSPRQRQTLDLVLSGLCDKEIAERLSISRYTVNQYTKAIYRHYAVTSRTQLLARLLVQPQAARSLIIGTGTLAAVP